LLFYSISMVEAGAGGRFESLIAGRVVGMTMGVNDVGSPVLQPFCFGQNSIGFNSSMRPIFFLNKAFFIKFTLMNLSSGYIIPNKLTFVDNCPETP